MTARHLLEGGGQTEPLRHAAGLRCSASHQLAAGSPITLVRHTVLLVDPSPTRLDWLESVLGGQYYCACAAAPEEALRVLRTQPIDLVIASGRVCSTDFLAAVAALGLSRSCIFFADAHEVERLVDAYAAQHSFRVLSSDASAQSVRGFVHSILYPRGRTRHSLPGIGATLVTIDGERLDCSLIDLSNRGLAVRLNPHDGLLLPGTRIDSVELQRDGTPLLDGVTGIVRYIEVLAPGPVDSLAYKVGLELFPSMPRAREAADQVLVEPVRIVALLQEGLTRSRLTVRIADAGTLVAIGCPAQLDRQKREVRVRGDAPIDLEVGDVVEARLELAGSSYSFVASVRQVDRADAPGYSLRLPRAVRVRRQRRSVRFRPHPERPVTVTLVSPFTGELDARPVLNVTASGVGFVISEELDLLPVGSRIPRLILRFNDGTELQCRARVRTLALAAGEQSGEAVCGVEFEGLSSTERGRIADGIVHAGQPDLRDGTAATFDDLWTFFQETGFLYAAKLASMKKEIVGSTLRRLLSEPNDLLKTSIFAKDGKIEGHASGVRVYRQTWMLQHLAARMTSKTTMTRGQMLNLAVIEYLEQLPGIEWVKIWYRPANRWPARVFGGFAHKLADHGLSSLATYEYMVSPALAAEPSRSGLTVRTGDEADGAWVEAFFVSAREAVLLRSDDLTSRHLMLKDVDEAYAEFGLARRRELLVAERAGRFLGFALLEVSSPGLNFSELTNTFRVFTAEPDREVQLALIASARERYLKLGFERCIGLVSEGEVAPFKALGFKRVKAYACWTWHRSHYQAFCEHILKLRA